MIAGDESLLTYGFETLLKLAIKFAVSNTTILINYKIINQYLKISLYSTGWIIPDKYQDCFFDLFGVTETIIPGGDLGLAPPLIGYIFKTFNGRIEFQNLKPDGVCFMATLPLVSNIELFGNQ